MAPCDGQGNKYRLLKCVWHGTKRPAGNACETLPRPVVKKACKSEPCISNCKYFYNCTIVFLVFLIFILPIGKPHCVRFHAFVPKKNSIFFV